MFESSSWDSGECEMPGREFRVTMARPHLNDDALEGRVSCRGKIKFQVSRFRSFKVSTRNPRTLETLLFFKVASGSVHRRRARDSDQAPPGKIPQCGAPPGFGTLCETGVLR